jgi:hypothetical protein
LILHQFGAYADSLGIGPGCFYRQCRVNASLTCGQLSPGVKPFKMRAAAMGIFWGNFISGVIFVFGVFIRACGKRSYACRVP